MLVRGWAKGVLMVTGVVGPAELAHLGFGDCQGSLGPGPLAER